jgi:hypothetical protein
MNKFTKIIAAIIMLATIVVVGCKKPEVPSHEFVDLGLPSGTLWATCNLGADQPEGYGDYFAWGETAPKQSYSWCNYKYGECIDDRVEMTKYCTDSTWGFNGFYDKLTVLEPVDDAATANWGADWRMPTKEDWEELYTNTTCTWTKQNDVMGMLLTSWNGNSIFLPAAGYCSEDEIISTALGIYWSSSLQLNLQVIAWSFHFTLDGCHVCGSYERNRGQVVRAVR